MKAFNLPLLPCLKLQAPWLKRFYCFVLALDLLGIVNLKVDQNSWDLGILFGEVLRRCRDLLIQQAQKVLL